MKWKWIVCIGIISLLKQDAIAQRICPTISELKYHLATNPVFRQDYEARQQQKKEYALNKALFKTAAAPTIPVVFHILLHHSDTLQIGGLQGIQQRIDSQMAVINRDFNRENADSIKIPAAFKPLYGNAEIRFGLAKQDPNGHCSPGYTLTVTGTPQSYGVFNYQDAKHSATGGVDAWDTDKYLNIWIVRTSSGLLGVATPGYLPRPGDEVGVLLNYGSFGKRVHASDFYSDGNDTKTDLGRTLTHELGHFFELFHPNGDDLSCPANGGDDDGISDTPPSYTNKIRNPVFPVTDQCSPNFPGVMFMNYMDYCDDLSLYMFTIEQCSVMHANVLPGGYAYSLTQNPHLLNCPTDTDDINQQQQVHIYPNPSTGVISIELQGNQSINQIHIINSLGQFVKTINISNPRIKKHHIDLSGVPAGIYTVQCIFADRIHTQKIIVQ